jgi:hypothetical protein
VHPIREKLVYQEKLPSVTMVTKVLVTTCLSLKMLANMLGTQFNSLKCNFNQEKCLGNRFTKLVAMVTKTPISLKLHSFAMR